ncbi:glycoside hydrolase family 5 protein [Lentithecium fluviatile CBS 122367]|uniref:mannan endo-1,4-beta-mannosidase n=1 Tax=Lentithecium fluviatile CBS 122367 TaxID=1168545 RepID=A0A6G1IKX2_9PLEO|nr:glycoside hydrolase family 5 protein [Lentithecium fluviatile CBS 122367]
MQPISVVGALILATAMGGVHCQPRARGDGSNSFAGSNLYFLHALPPAEQKAYVETLAEWGVRVVRLWVTYTDAGCLKGSTVGSIPPFELTVGTYDNTVLDVLDSTLKLLHDNSIKAIISPHNANSLTGSAACDAYCDKYTNASTFYSSTEAKADYDNRLNAILSYRSPNFGGRAWKDMGEVILAFDLQNEPLIAQLDKLNANDPDDWLCGRAGALKGSLGSSNIKVATGGIGGSQYCCDHEFNLLDKALQCDAIDILSVHGYMSKASDWAYFITGDKSVLVQANAAGKHVMVEEWGVSTSYQDNFDRQVEVFNDAGIPWLYWQVVPGLDGSQAGHPDECGYDGFEISVDSPKGDLSSAVAAANAATANQSWVGYIG